MQSIKQMLPYSYLNGRRAGRNPFGFPLSECLLNATRQSAHTEVGSCLSDFPARGGRHKSNVTVPFSTVLDFSRARWLLFRA